MRKFKTKDLKELPTIKQGHFDDIKIISNDGEGKYRVSLSRMTKEDGEIADNMIHIERYSPHCGWYLVDSYPG